MNPDNTVNPVSDTMKPLWIVHPLVNWHRQSLVKWQFYWLFNEQSVRCWWTQSIPSISSQIDLITVFVVTALHVFLCGVRSFNKKILINQMFCVKWYNWYNLIFHFGFWCHFLFSFFLQFCIVLWCRCIAHHHQVLNKLHCRIRAEMNNDFFFFFFFLKKLVNDWIKTRWCLQWNNITVIVCTGDAGLLHSI